MSVKRQATTDLNHDNWDKEEPSDHEEMGTFRSASKEVLEKRVIKTAKRRSNLSSGDRGNTSVFSGFGGFNRAQPSSFDFLADLTNGANTNGGPITSTKGDSTVSSSLFSGKPIASTGIGNSTFSTPVMFGANNANTNTAPTTQATPFSFISSTKQQTATGSVFTTTKADSTVEESVFKNQPMSTFSSNQTGFSFNPPTSQVKSSVFGAPSSNAKTPTVFGASSSNATTTVFGMPATSSISTNMFGVPSTSAKTSAPFGTPTTIATASLVTAVQSSATQSTTFRMPTTIAITSSSAKTPFGTPTTFTMPSPMSLQSSANTSGTFGVSTTSPVSSPGAAMQPSANTTTFVAPAAIGMTSPSASMQSSANTFKMPTTIIKSSSTFGSPTTTAMGSSGIPMQQITKTSTTFGGHSTAKSSVFGVPPSGAIASTVADTISTSEQTSTVHQVSTSANKSPAKQSNKSAKIKHSVPDTQNKISSSSNAKLRYHNKLSSLNKCVSEWINKHVQESPCCILSPVFKDYNDYLKEIKDEYHASSNKINRPDDNEIATQNLNENKSLSKHSQQIKEGQLKEKPSAFPKPDSPNKKTKEDVQFNKQTSPHPKQDTQSNIKLPEPPSTQPSAGSIFTKMGSSPKSVFGGNKPSVSSSAAFTPPSTINTPFGINNTSISPSFSFNVKTPFQANVTTASANSVFSSNPLQTPATSTPFSFGTGKPFSFNTNIEKKPDSQEEEAENEEDKPPKVEFTPLVEENSVYDKKCKIFVKKDGNFVDNGVGTLYIKKIEETGKHQLLVRANTSLGIVLINLILVQAIPIQRMGKNNVMMMCIPTPEAEPPPTPILIRVKTSEEADELLETLNKYKT